MTEGLLGAAPMNSQREQSAGVSVVNCSLCVLKIELQPFFDVVKCKTVKVCFYIAHYPVHCTAQKRFTVFLPWQTCSFRYQLGFSWRHSSHVAITRNDYSLTFPPLSIVRYSLQLSELRDDMERTEMPKL